MRLAILHHHLDPGGVTRVVAAHLRSLDASPAGGPAVDGDRLDPRVVVLSGPRTGGDASTIGVWPPAVSGLIASSTAAASCWLVRGGMLTLVVSFARST
ncbi:MAG: hypothetical protein AAGJ97_09565 [Planctomycetota bacterium]